MCEPGKPYGNDIAFNVDNKDINNHNFYQSLTYHWRNVWIILSPPVLIGEHHRYRYLTSIQLHLQFIYSLDKGVECEDVHRWVIKNINLKVMKIYCCFIHWSHHSLVISNDCVGSSVIFIHRLSFWNMNIYPFYDPIYTYASTFVSSREIEAKLGNNGMLITIALVVVFVYTDGLH